MSLSEKPQTPDLSVPSPILSRLIDTFSAFQERRAALGLSNPGTVEDISKEVHRNVFLNNQTFTGLRADITRMFGASPLFQVSHAFSMGSQMMTPYTFAALYGSNKVFMQASVNSDKSLTSVFNYRWNSSFMTKTNLQIASHGTMVQLENAYTGPDFTASLKTMNPSILDDGLTGIFVGSYMQSITRRLSLGLEGVWQRAAMNRGPEVLVSYAGRYKGDDWVASAQLLAQGGLSASYWRRLSERVETGVDLNLQFAAEPGLMGAQISKEGTATLGAKYDFRASAFRAQVDSKGRVACLLEKRVAPPVSVTFSGEIDHSKSEAKIGLGVSIEEASEDMIRQQESGLEADMASPPF